MLRQAQQPRKKTKVETNIEDKRKKTKGEAKRKKKDKS